MPVYVFECECGNTLERLVPMGTSSIKCENCGKGMNRIRDAIPERCSGLVS